MALKMMARSKQRLSLIHEDAAECDELERREMLVLSHLLSLRCRILLRKLSGH